MKSQSARVKQVNMSARVQALAALVGEENVLWSPEDQHVYRFDGTPVLKGPASEVVLPRSVGQVAGVVRWARENRVPLVTRGSGTGLSGGSVPVAGCVVVCLARMDRILGVDSANLVLHAEAGATTQRIAEAAEAAGLFYPPDPGSIRISTIGGNVAENSGGLRGLKYGVTRDYVMALEVVLPDGSVVTLGNTCVKDVAGYSMRDLFVGSEGTLGIVTRVTLALVPRPRARRTLLALYDRMEDAAKTVSAIIAAQVIPCTLEFLDRTTIGCVEDYAAIGLPRDCEAVLLMETDGHPAAVAEEAAAMESKAREFGAREVQVAVDAAESARLASARRVAFSALARVAPTTILEDVTVPRSCLAEMVRHIQDIGARHRLRIGTFGHFGDGNLHPTILTNERDAGEMARVEAALQEIFARTKELGGTITGEHGVGLAKKPYLEASVGSRELELMRAFKRSVDPDNLMNPGKILDLAPSTP